MFIAITGTPGTGKTTAAALLDRPMITVEELAETYGCLEGDQVDVERLRERAREPQEDMIVEGHLAHWVSNGLCIVLRLDPDVLKDRLEARGYETEKAMENAEAEAIDLILTEALEMSREVREIDTTGMLPQDVAGTIENIIKDGGDVYAPGKVDWSGVVMEWY